MKIWLELQNMGHDELIKHVPMEELADIQNSHDAIEAYVVAHPGESATHEVGAGTKFIKWLKHTISAVKEKIKPGTPVFHLHGEDNSTENRTAIGRVISTFQDTKDRVISVIRRFKNYLDIKTDVASFEAPVRSYIPDLDGHYMQPHEIGDITGIALANSETSKPAFAGAYREAFLQCLKKETNMPIQLSDVLSFIQENGIKPLQIFSPETLLEVDPVKEAIAAKKGNENLYHENMRLQATLKSEREKWDTEKTAHGEELKKRDNIIIVYKTKEVFKDELAKRKDLTESHVKFIDIEKENMKIEPDKEIPAQVNDFLDHTLKKYDTQKAIFNPNPEKEKEQGKIKEPEKQATGDMSFIPNYAGG